MQSTLEAGDYDNNIRGPITLDGSDGRDTLVFNDLTDGPNSDNWSIIDTTITKGAAEPLTYGLVEVVQIDASANNETIRVKSFPENVELIVNANDGDDLIYLGEGDFDTQVEGTLTVNGGIGADRLIFKDQSDGYGSDTWTITNTTVDKGVAETLAYSMLETLTIHASANNDTFHVNSLGNIGLVINANDGDDTVNLGGGDYDSNVRGVVTVNGGAGSNTLVFDDSNDGVGSDYCTITNTTIEKDTRVLNYQEFGTIQYEASANDDVIHLDSLSPQVELTVAGNVGNDTVNVGNGDYASIVRGNVSFNGGAGTDVLNWNDRSATPLGDFHFTPIAIGCTITNSSISISRKGGDSSVDYDEVETIRVDTGSADDAVYVNGLDSGVELTVNMGDGEDLVEVGDGDYDSRVHGTVTTDGGAGADRLVFNDHNDGVNSDTFTITTDTIQKGGADPLAYGQFEEIYYDASPNSDTINVNSLSSGVELTIDANHGDDRIYVGDGDYDSNIHGNVSVTGGAGGDDAVTVNDSGDKGADTYTIAPGTFHKGGAVLTYGPASAATDVESFTLNANVEDNLIRINGTSPGMPVTVHANNGNDVFDVLGPVSSDLFLLGEGPTVAPGDSLRLTGTPTGSGVYRPDPVETGAGMIGFDGQTINFSGLEPVTVSGFRTFELETPNSVDNLHIDMPTPGRHRLSGTSGGVAFESLTFSDVDTLIVDMGTADSGAAADQLVVIGGDMPAAGVNLLEVQSGTGSNLVQVDAGVINLTTSAAGTGTNSVDAKGSGTVVNLVANELLESLSIGAGSAVNMTPGGDKALVVKTLSIQGGDDPSGTLCINDNGVIVNYLDGYKSPLPVHQAQIDHARDDNAPSLWTAEGIISADAAANPATVSVEAAEALDVFGSAGGTFFGIPLAPGDQAVLIQTTDIVPPGITITPTSGLVTTEAGGTAQFSVVLDSQPTANVTIPLSSSDTSEGTVCPASLTFTPSNWATPQTVTVTGVDDLVDDGNGNYAIVTAPAVSSDTMYHGLDAHDVSVINQNDDNAWIRVMPNSSFSTTEAGDTTEFSVRLNSQPTADVVIAISSSDTTEGTVSTDSLTFTPSNWSTPQTVTVTGVDDDVDDGNVNYTIVTAPAVSADPLYNGRNSADIGLANVDDDTAAITVKPTSGLVTSEAGGTARFSVVLESQPTAPVIIAVVSSDLTEGAVSPDSLTFDASNWSTPQTVTATGVDDDVDDGNTHYKIVTATSATSDSSYAGLYGADFELVNADDDTAGITVTPTSGLVTTEAGGTAKFFVALDSQPTAPVTIAISSSDLTEGTSSLDSLVFDASNWSTPQEVTVTGANDDVVDGDVDYTILTDPAVSGDVSYSDLNSADVSVTNLDNDVMGGIKVSQIFGLQTSEAGGTAQFEIALESQPTANVTIALSSSNVAEGTVSTQSVLFDPLTWWMPQTVTVTGVDDNIDDGDADYTIVTAASVSPDPMYNGIDAADVTLINTDDDTAGITVSSSANSITTESGGTSQFKVLLDSQPTAEVTIALSSSDYTEGTISPSSVVFTPSNWLSPQIVTVNGVDDDVDDGDVGFTIITDPAASWDTVYNGLDAGDVTLVNTDDDTAGITVSPTSGLITTEAGGTAQFTVVLDSQPTADVVVELYSNDTSEGTLSPDKLTFTSENWSEPQTVTVTGVNDSLGDGDVVFSIITSASAPVTSAYAGIDPTDVTVTNLDDSPAIVVGRHIFYNNSAFDANDPAANKLDDAAIATDKTALLPGEKATFANYTSYSRGINGIMVDIQGLADPAAVADGDLSEFEFKYGNDDTPDDWLSAPGPSGVEVRDLGGDVSRVTFTWDDNAIPNRNWLQVTAKQQSATGLAADDVFYFGNSAGETTGDFVVNYDDLLYAIWPVIFTAVGAESPADINRDGVVNYDDLLDPNAFWDNVFKSPPLTEMSPPAPAAAASALFDSVLNEDLSWAAEVVSFDELYGTSKSPSKEGVLESRAADSLFNLYA